MTVLARSADEPEVRAALLDPFDRPVETEEPATRVLDVEPAEQPATRDDEPLRDHVVLLGHGGVGSVLARLLRQRALPFVVIEQDHTTATALRRQGVRVLQGNGEDPELLDRAGIQDARMLLVTTTQPVAARRAIEHARRLNTRIEVITRVHHDSLRITLSALPRTRCVQGDVELAYAMARVMLLACGVSAIETEALVIDARRGEHEPSRAPTRVIEIHVPAGSPVIGKRLADLELPAGSLVITISRAGEFVVPSGQIEICADDALLVLADMDKARTIGGLIDTKASTPDASSD